MMKTFDQLYDNMYNPHLEIVQYIPISDKKPDIKLEFAEKMQILNEKTVENTINTGIEPNSKSNTTIVEPEILPTVIVKDITPKKGLFRRK